jgi:hypothetical protein
LLIEVLDLFGSQLDGDAALAVRDGPGGHSVKGCGICILPLPIRNRGGMMCEPSPEHCSMVMLTTARTKRWMPCGVVAAGLASDLLMVPLRTTAGYSLR